MIIPVLDLGRGGDLELIGRIRMIGQGMIEVLDLLEAVEVGR
jgi:hypothetical protein